MKITFRIDCPHKNVNMGFLKATCRHCEKQFFFKITVTGINIEIKKKLDPDIPCSMIKE
jgi:hypothetical protein